MARGFPSMTALLGLAAIAGYQNRDKIAAFINGAGRPGPGGSAPQGGGLSGVLGQLFGDGSRAPRSSGVPVFPRDDRGSAFGAGGTLSDDLVDRIVHQTGLSRGEVLARLSRD